MSRGSMLLSFEVVACGSWSCVPKRCSVFLCGFPNFCVFVP